MKLTITQPDDWHVHFRDNDSMKAIVNDTAKICGRAVVMPNLQPPVTTVSQAIDYHNRIMNAVEHKHFKPLMTLYLTSDTSVEEIKKAKQSDIVHAFKLYPAGATTNSAAGIQNLEDAYPLFEAMQDIDIPLLIHGEVVDKDIDIFDREAVFIERTLKPIVVKFPKLRIILEHITTKEAVDFVTSAPSNVAATITPHHLLANRNHMLVGGIRPHYFCLPIIKRESHRVALLEAATSGNPKFFLGTDSAPHPKHAKENACGCAGIYSSHIAIELYAKAFEQVDALDKLEGFASFYGADFYGLPRNKKKITLIKEDQKIPETLMFGSDQLVPFKAGETISWNIDKY